jgi:holliday junction DNA helicase RuvB
VYRMEFYGPAELESIVVRSAGVLGVGIHRDGAAEIAHRARGTPRIVNRLIKRIRDYAQVKADGKITKHVAQEGLAWLGIDEAGFDDMDRKILLTIIEKFNGGPVGVESLAATVQEDKGTIEDVYEPYLIQAGFLDRTGRGRQVTRLAYDHFKRSSPFLM